MFSPDGSRIVTVSHDDTGRIWDAKTGAELLTLKGLVVHGSVVQSFADDSRICIGGIGSTKVLDARPLNRDFLPKELAPPPRNAAGP
jgi:WD40 repeat protein